MRSISEPKIMSATTQPPHLPGSNTGLSSRSLPNLTSRRALPSKSTLIGLLVALAVICLATTIGASASATDIVFKACFGTLLCLFGCIQLFVAYALFQNRHNSLLELSQPTSLAIFAFAGAVATLASFLFTLPEINAACASRRPIILLSVTLMGNILVARSWRIGRIVSPAGKLSTIGSSSSSMNLNGEGGRRRVTLNGYFLDSRALLAYRWKIMEVLSDLSRWTLVIGSCGRYKERSQKAMSLRQQVTLADSGRVTSVLMLPQIILQIVNLSVPDLRMQSFAEGGMDVDYSIHECQCEAEADGLALLIVGVLFSALPFFLALLLNVASEGMPKIFLEFDEIAASVKASFCVLLITLPTIGMIANTIPNAHAYLLAASLLSFILPMCYNITSPWVKACSFKKDNDKQDQGPALKRQATTTNFSTRSSTDVVSSSRRSDNLVLLQQAADALTMSSMFETMGRMKKSIDVIDTTLTMFKGEGGYSCNDGFTKSEINAMGPKTLEVIVSSLISRSKRLAAYTTFCHGDERTKCMGESFTSMRDALNIFDLAPAKRMLKDRSVVFPGYSFMAQLIKAGVAESPTKTLEQEMNFEDGIASNFVEETQYNLFHYCRSMSMLADMKARHQKFNDALTIVEDIKVMYNPKLHSLTIAESYGSDHCAVTVAMSAIWLHHLNRKEEALERCNEVIETILPEVSIAGSLLGITYLLAPVIQVLRAQGPEGVIRARELYYEHVAKPFHSGIGRESHAKYFVRPLSIVLDCDSNASDTKNTPGMACDIVRLLNEEGNDIGWLLNGEEKIFDDFESSWTNTVNWSFYSLLAESCLHIAKRLDGCEGQKKALIEEGLRVSSLAESKMRDKDGNVATPIAYSWHEQIYLELQGLNEARDTTQ